MKQPWWYAMHDDGTDTPFARVLIFTIAASLLHTAVGVARYLGRNAKKSLP